MFVRTMSHQLCTRNYYPNYCHMHSFWVGKFEENLSLNFSKFQKVRNSPEPQRTHETYKQTNMYIKFKSSFPTGCMDQATTADVLINCNKKVKT